MTVSKQELKKLQDTGSIRRTVSSLGLGEALNEIAEAIVGLGLDINACTWDVTVTVMPPDPEVEDANPGS